MDVKQPLRIIYVGHNVEQKTASRKYVAFQMMAQDQEDPRSLQILNQQSPKEQQRIGISKPARSLNDPNQLLPEELPMKTIRCVVDRPRKLQK